MPIIDTDDNTTIHIKREVEEMEVDVINSDDIKEEHIAADIKIDDDSEVMQDAINSGSRYCKSCDIPFNYFKSYIAHKKFYCSSHAGEITQAGNNNNTSNNRTAEASVL